jgi:hypothetical protein
MDDWQVSRPDRSAMSPPGAGFNSLIWSIKGSTLELGTLNDGTEVYIVVGVLAHTSELTPELPVTVNEFEVTTVFDRRTLLILEKQESLLSNVYDSSGLYAEGTVFFTTSREYGFRLSDHDEPVSIELPDDLLQARPAPTATATPAG